jgi:hypothetical protein
VDELPPLEKRILSGSQAKTAFALRSNCEAMVNEFGLNRTGFGTFTVGDYFCPTHGKQIPKVSGGRCPCCRVKMPFIQVFDADEASRRMNSLATNCLKKIFKRSVLVTERHETLAIHFHLLGILHADVDIRTGFDFEAVQRRRYSSVPKALAAIWADLRRVLPRYGFGRFELTPIKSTAGAVASYVSKYIEKNILNRPACDKGRKLVRYLGWHKLQLKTNEFEWNTKGSKYWRCKIAQLAKCVGLRVWDNDANDLDDRIVRACDAADGKIRPKSFNGSMLKKIYGPRWAYTAANVMREVWGDNCDLLTVTPAKLLQAQNLLITAQRRYEKTQIDNFRWLKGLVWHQIEFGKDAEESVREFWAMEAEAEGLGLSDDFQTN